LSYHYVEIYPVPAAALGGRTPVFRLAPRPGDVDLLIAFELVEAGRVLGYADKTRTTLIASTHRFYTVAEKVSASDGRFDAQPILDAAPLATRHAILFDMAEIVRTTGGSVSAVALGACANVPTFPVPAAPLEAAIRGAGIEVEANLAAFARGRAAVVERGRAAVVERGRTAAVSPAPAAGAAPERPPLPSGIDDLLARVEATFPADARALVGEGVARVADYQDATYAAHYLDLLDPIRALDQAADHGLTRETARYLALWMTYEDVIRVAELKSRPARFRRIRAEADVGDEAVVRVTEFFKPGLPELTAILPVGAAQALRRWARAFKLERRFNVGLHIRSTAPWGFALLWLLRRLKPFRRRSLGFAEERAAIARWLAAVKSAAEKDAGLGREVAACGRLIKGYSDTRARGFANFERIFAAAVTPALAGTLPPAAAQEAIAALRAAALADPEGDRLAKAEAALRDATTAKAAE
jgi:indolepyruvate ferredoxin oxidoreductase beta subunit